MLLIIALLISCSFLKAGFFSGNPLDIRSTIMCTHNGVPYRVIEVSDNTAIPCPVGINFSTADARTLAFYELDIIAADHHHETGTLLNSSTSSQTNSFIFKALYRPKDNETADPLLIHQKHDLADDSCVFGSAYL